MSDIQVQADLVQQAQVGASQLDQEVGYRPDQAVDFQLDQVAACRPAQVVASQLDQEVAFQQGQGTIGVQFLPDNLRLIEKAPLLDQEQG